MFEVGFSELLLIFAIALVVLGPQKLPKLAQQVGKWVGRARAMARQFREQLEEEAHKLETNMTVDPDIDTSLDPKPKPQSASAPPADAAPAAEPPPAPAPVPEKEEEFYPPDHHMHSAQRANGANGEAHAAPDESTAQTEMDLAAPPEEAERKQP